MTDIEVFSTRTALTSLGGHMRPVSGRRNRSVTISLSLKKVKERCKAQDREIATLKSAIEIQDAKQNLIIKTLDKTLEVHTAGEVFYYIIPLVPHSNIALAICSPQRPVNVVC